MILKTKGENIMKEFLQEWGNTILTAIAIMALIGIVVFLKPTMKSAFESTFTSFSNQMQSAVDDNAGSGEATGSESSGSAAAGN